MLVFIKKNVVSLFNSRHQGMKCLVLFLMLLFISSLPGFTQQMQGGPVQAKLVDRDNLIYAEFWVRGRLIGRLAQTEDVDKFNARVENWTRRLNDLFTGKTSVSSIRVVSAGGVGIVCRGSQQILIFDKQTASAMKTTPTALANTWAANIRFALKYSPTFTVKDKNITVPLNESVSIVYEGSFNKGIVFYDYNTDEIAIEQDAGNNRIKITGINLGKGLFKARAGDIEQTVYYRVQERAGQAPSSLAISVAGKPASVGMIKDALKSTAMMKCSPKMGASVVLGSPLNKGEFKNLNPGQTLNLTIPIKVMGENYIPSIQKAKVSIENVGYQRPLPQILIVSNKPEIIKEDGELMATEVRPSTPARYFYHHKNAHHQAWRYLYVTLENKGSIPSRVFVSPVGAGPTPDELHVGHMAMSDFLDSRKSGTGWFVTIKPGASYVVERRLVKTDQTVSGLGYFNILEGTALQFSVHSQTIPGKLPPENSKPYVEKPDVRISKGVFPSFIDLTPVHKIGGNYTYIYLGGEPYQQDLNDGHPNYGNYGAMYNIDISIENSYEDEREASIYFVPGGGVARGIFEVDGVLLETPLAQPAQKVLLKKIKVAPGRTEKVMIKTIPQGGAYYPVKIVVESEFVKNSNRN